MMKTIEQLEAEIAQLQQDLERLKSKPEPIIERQKTYKFINSYFGFGSYVDTDGKEDRACFAAYNYYPDNCELCQRVANYLRKTHLFTRKAIEFADGYEYKPEMRNYFVIFNKDKDKFESVYDTTTYNPLNTYMFCRDSRNFADWCNEHRKELGYE